jgi:hypothetical protein
MAGGRRAREMGQALNRTCDADDLAAFRAFADGLYGKVTGPLSWRADGDRSCYAWTGISYDLRRVVWLDISNQSLSDIIASRCRCLRAVGEAANLFCIFSGSMAASWASRCHCFA